VMRAIKPALAARTRPRTRPRWWIEVAIVGMFYAIYTGIRNLFGSASVSPHRALHNATEIIDLERSIGLFREQRVQSWFLDWDWFMRSWNIFYGTFHFAVTIFALTWLFFRHPARYTRYRNVLAIATAAALVGFTLYPLMPPRLLGECGTTYGGCSSYGIVDSLSRYGGLWSFDSGTMQSISNQYAAMPSLHFAWSSWCWLALRPVVRRRSLRVALAAYPWLTLFAIIVTANHFWIDAAGGALVLGIGYLVGSLITRAGERWRVSGIRRRDSSSPEIVTDLQQFLDAPRTRTARPGR